ncbi:MAG: hemoglobin [Halioglobus sp.]|jgi:hemoglobin
MSTLYECLGGEDAVDAAVDIFYDKVIANERINGFFLDMDMVAQADKQKKFLTMAFGGPNDYSGKDIRNAHAHLGVTEEHFNAVVENLANILKELGASDADIGEVAAVADSVKADVLNL